MVSRRPEILLTEARGRGSARPPSDWPCPRMDSSERNVSVE